MALPTHTFNIRLGRVRRVRRLRAPGDEAPTQRLGRQPRRRHAAPVARRTHRHRCIARLVVRVAQVGERGARGLRGLPP